MASFSLSQRDLSGLVDQEFLYDLLGAEAFDAPKVNRIVTLQDLKNHPELTHPAFNRTLHDLVVAYLQTVVADYSESHKVNDNLGSITKRDDSFSFWGAGIYYNDENGLYLSIGGTDDKNDVHPLIIPFSFSEESQFWTIPKGSPIINQSWSTDSYDLADNSTRYSCNFNLLNPRSSVSNCKAFSIWIRTAKLQGDDSNQRVCEDVVNAVYEQESSFAELIQDVPKGGMGTFAKAGQIFSQYYAQKRLKKIAFPVVGLTLQEGTNKETGETFKQLQASVDFSGYPNVPVLAVEIGNKEGKQVDLSDVTMIQFNVGKEINPTELMKKYLASKAHLDKVESGLSTPDPALAFPSPEKPWYIEFLEAPKVPTHTPPYAVWTKFLPTKVSNLLKQAKNPSFLTSVSSATSAVVDVPSVPVTVPATVVDVTEDDF